jgi:hypothetical protein
LEGGHSGTFPFGGVLLFGGEVERSHCPGATSATIEQQVREEERKKENKEVRSAANEYAFIGGRYLSPHYRHTGRSQRTTRRSCRATSTRSTRRNSAADIAAATAPKPSPKQINHFAYFMAFLLVRGVRLIFV